MALIDIAEAANGQVRVQLEYNAGNHFVTGVIVQNTSTHAELPVVTAVNPATGRTLVVQVLIPPGTTSLRVPVVGNIRVVEDDEHPGTFLSPFEIGVNVPFAG